MICCFSSAHHIPRLYQTVGPEMLKQNTVGKEMSVFSTKREHISTILVIFCTYLVPITHQLLQFTEPFTEFSFSVIKTVFLWMATH